MTRAVPRPPHPQSQVVSPPGIATREWLQFFDEMSRVLQERLAVCGTAEFSASTTKDVTLDVTLPDTNYNVTIDAPENKTFWVTNKATTGFRINASSSSSATVGWTLVRR